MASVLHVNAITGTTGVGSQEGSPIQMSGDTATLGSAVNFPTGHVLQVKNTLMGNRLNFTPTSQTWTDIAGLSVQITPSSSSNKIN